MHLLEHVGLLLVANFSNERIQTFSEMNFVVYIKSPRALRHPKKSAKWLKNFLSCDEILYVCRSHRHHRIAAARNFSAKNWTACISRPHYNAVSCTVSPSPWRDVCVFNLQIYATQEANAEQVKAAAEDTAHKAITVSGD